MLCFHSSACAAFTPARVRSEIKPISNSANTPIIGRMAWAVGVAVSTEFHTTGSEVIQHRYQFAQTAAQMVKLPRDERIAPETPGTNAARDYSTLNLATVTCNCSAKLERSVALA